MKVVEVNLKQDVEIHGIAVEGAGRDLKWKGMPISIRRGLVSGIMQIKLRLLNDAKNTIGQILNTGEQNLANIHETTVKRHVRQTWSTKIRPVMMVKGESCLRRMDMYAQVVVKSVNHSISLLTIQLSILKTIMNRNYFVGLVMQGFIQRSRILAIGFKNLGHNSVSWLIRL